MQGFLKGFNGLGLLLDCGFQPGLSSLEPEKEVQALSQKSTRPQLPKEESERTSSEAKAPLKIVYCYLARMQEDSAVVFTQSQKAKPCSIVLLPYHCMRSSSSGIATVPEDMSRRACRFLEAVSSLSLFLMAFFRDLA